MIEYPSHADLEWVAVDRNGHLGVFTTGGRGPIPRIYLTHPEALDRLSDLVWGLPEVSDHELLVTLPRPDDFIAFARRGMFSFDWTDVHRSRKEESKRYEVQARPTVPMSSAAFPWSGDLRGILCSVTSSVLDFRDAAIDVLTAFECAAEPAVAADAATPRR